MNDSIKKRDSVSTSPGHRDGVSAGPRPWRVEDSIIVDSDGGAIAAMCEPDCTGDAALIVEAVNERDRLRDLVRRMIPSVAASLAVSKAEGEALDRWLALIREACEGRRGERGRCAVKILPRSKCAILPLVLKGEWYDMIACGEKREEYRDDTPYWNTRISRWFNEGMAKAHHVVAFSRGYARPTMFFRVDALVRVPRRTNYPEWGEPTSSHWVIGLGERVELEEEARDGQA